MDTRSAGVIGRRLSISLDVAWELAVAAVVVAWAVIGFVGEGYDA